MRIDYLFDQDAQAIYVNEINTIPGSLAFYLWEHENISFSMLIDKIIDAAFSAQKEKEYNTYAFDSDVLNKVNLGSKGAKRSNNGSKN